MEVIVVGAGIAGSICSLLLARQGHDVLLVDRDAGPPAHGGWQRRGVMQSHQPHTWRAPFRMVLLEHLPDVLARLEEAGVQAARADGAPEATSMLLCRREVLEPVLWAATAAEPGVTRVTGHADGIAVRDGRARGVVVDGREHDATLVVDASGRAGRLAREHRPAAEGGTCSMTYTSQVFRLLPDAEPGPVNSPVGLLAFCQGYQPIVFVHDAGTFSALIIRAAHDPELDGLREPAGFAAAYGAIPGMADWTAPERSEPIGPVRTGGNLTNLFTGQPRLAGVVAIGDAVATTNPNGARGGSLAALGAVALARTVAEHPADPMAWGAAMAAWSDREVRPWWADHVAVDASLHRRWRGEPPDPDGVVSSDLVSAALDDLPELIAELGPYFAMFALPGTVDPARERVRGLLRTGWRPPFSEGPGRTELAGVLRDAVAT